MDTAEKLSITLPVRLAKLVRAKVAEGAYASNSEVIREALRVWQDREDTRNLRLDEVRRELAEAMSDPRPSIRAERVFEGIRELHRHTLRKARKAPKTRRHGS